MTEQVFKVGVLALDKRGLKKILNDMKGASLRVEFSSPRSRFKAFAETLAAEPREITHLTLIDRQFSPGAEVEKALLDSARTRAFFDALEKLQTLTLEGHNWFSALEHKNLETLDVNGYAFGLANSIAQRVECPKLESLRWSFGGDDYGVAHSPDVFGELWEAKGLPNLKSLDLGDIDIDGALLEEPTFVKGGLLKQLKTLVLPKSNVDLKTLKDAMTFMGHLDRIVVDDEALLKVSDRIEVVVKNESATEPDELVHVVLGHNEGDEDLRRKLTQAGELLESLTIATRLISAEGAKALGALLQDCPKLHTLNIGRQGTRAFAAEEFEMFAQSMGSHHELKVLDLAYNKLSGAGPALSVLLEKSPNVEIVDLNHGSMNAEDINALVPTLNASSSLKELRVASSASDEAAGHAWNKLNSPSLERFIIWTTKFPKDACTAFVRDMGTRLPSLKYLDHGWADYHADTLWAMAKGFEGHRNLEELEIALRVSTEGYEALGHLLEHTLLKRLELREAPPENEAQPLAIDTLSVLSKAEHLERLDFDGLFRKDNAEVLEALFVAMRSMKRLRHVHGLWIDVEEDEALDRLADLLAQTPAKSFSKLDPSLWGRMLLRDALEHLELKTSYNAQSIFESLKWCLEKNQSLVSLTFDGGNARRQSD